MATPNATRPTSETTRDIFISITGGASGAVRVAIKGKLDAVTVIDLRREIDRLVLSKPDFVEVDLADTRLVDSYGVGVLIALYKSVSAYGGKAVVTGLRDQPLAIFRTLRLDRIMCGPGRPA